MSLTANIVALDIQNSIRKYKEYIELANKRKNRVCIGTCIGAIGIWCYRQFSPIYLPSVGVICAHSICNHPSVYEWLHNKTLCKLFPLRNLNHTGYRYMIETGCFMALDYAVIKWLSPQFIPTLHKSIIMLRHASLWIGGFLGLAIGSLYIPQVQNYIIKRVANSLRQAPSLPDLIRAYSGMPPPTENNNANPVIAPLIIPYSKVAELLPLSDITVGSDLSCGICMQDAYTIINTDKTHLAKLKVCGHLFCIPCIEAWLNIALTESVRQPKYCPMCRTDILSPSDIPIPETPSDGLEDHLRWIAANFRF